MKREKRRGQGNVEQEEPGRGTCTRERELLPEHTSTILHTRRGERRTRTDAAVARKKSRRGQGRRLVGVSGTNPEGDTEREREGESTSEPGDATDGANVEKREEEELRENESAHCKRERRQREKDERSESRERA